MLKQYGTSRSAYAAAVFLAILLFAPSCAGQGGDEADGPDAIRQQISAYREEINTLATKVNELERQLIARGEHTGRNAVIPVTADTVEQQTFQNFFTVSATAEAVNKATISPEINGHLKRIYVNKGDPVRQGQVLARLATGVMESNIEEVKTSLQLAQTVYERQQRLWRQEIGSEIQYLEAKNNVESLQGRLQTLQSQLDLAELRAPIDGFVDEIILKEGELAMPGTPLMQIVSLDQLYVNADISEAYLRYVHEGDSVLLRFPSYPDVEMHVPVHRVGHTIHPESRSFRMQLRIANSNGRLKPNMMARVSVRTFHIPDAVVVPSILIGYDNQGHYVFTAREREGLMVAEKTYIDRGADGEGKTLVESGLKPGDLLIRKGYNRVSSGDPIRIETD